jgi:hypothetical protein
MPMHIVVGDSGAVTLPTICQWFSKDIEGE